MNAPDNSRYDKLGFTSSADNLIHGVVRDTIADTFREYGMDCRGHAPLRACCAEAARRVIDKLTELGAPS